MKVATALLVGLITFSYAGVAAASSRCAPSEPKNHNSSINKSTFLQQTPFAAMMMLWQMH